MGLGPARSQRLVPLLLHLPSLATVLVVVENLNEFPCGFRFGRGGQVVSSVSWKHSLESLGMKALLVLKY